MGPLSQVLSEGSFSPRNFVKQNLCITRSMLVIDPFDSLIVESPYSKDF